MAARSTGHASSKEKRGTELVEVTDAIPLVSLKIFHKKALSIRSRETTGTS